MPKKWGIPGKMREYLSPGEQAAKLPKVPLNANPLNAWDYKKSKYRRIDLYPVVQQGGVPEAAEASPSVSPSPTASLTPTPTITPTITLTPTVTITPSTTQTCVEYGPINGYVNPIVQYNNQYYLAGTFTTFSGVSSSRFVRLSLNGDVDTTFSSNMGTGFGNGNPTFFGFQSDGKIVCGGNFTSFNGNSANRIVRLNSNGSYDNTFNSGTGFAGGPVLALQVLSNDKILVGGQITSYNGTAINYMVRLNADGTLDNTFNPLPDNLIQGIQVQSDGKYIIGGGFQNIDVNPAFYLARLNSDGSYDSSFDTSNGFDNAVTELALQSDGKVVCAGQAFTNYSGVSANRIIRLNSDATIDTSFVYGTGFNAQVLDVHLQSNGKILLSGQFTTYNGASNYKLVRLNTDGSVDGTFVNGLTFSNAQLFMDELPSGRIAIGGIDMSSYGGSIVYNWAILNENGGLIDCTITPISPTPTNTQTRTPTPSVTSTLTPTPTVTETPTETPTPTVTETPTPTPSATPSVAGEIYQFEECGNPSNVFRYDNVPVALTTGTTYEITSSNTNHILQEDGGAILTESGDFLDQEGSNEFVGFATVVTNTSLGPLYSSNGITFTVSNCPTPTPTPTTTETPTPTPTLTNTPTTTCAGYEICFVGSGATFEDLCSNPQPIPCLYSPQPFFTNEQQLYRDTCLTQFIDWSDDNNALFLSTGGTQLYFYGNATFGLSTYGFTCPEPSPTPTITPTETPTNTPTPTITPTLTQTPSSTPPAAFDPDAATYLATVLSNGGTLDSTISAATNTLFTSLKSNGLYTKMRVMYPMLGGVADSVKFNALNPLNTNGAFRLTYNGGGTYSYDASGLTINNADLFGTSFANTYFNASTQFSANSLTTGIYLFNQRATSANSFWFGAYEGATPERFLSIEWDSVNNGGEIFSRANKINQTGLTYGNIRGQWTLGNDGTNNYFRFNGASIGTGTDTTARPNGNIYLGTLNLGGSGYRGVHARFQFFYVSTYLSPSEAATIEGIINTFQTSLGRNTY